MSSTLLQKLAVQKLSEIIRNSKGGKSVCMGKILREAGYSKQTSLKPKLVTETKGFREEMDKVVPDVKLINALNELLHACVLKTMSFNSRLSDKEITEIVEKSGEFKVRDIFRKNSHAFSRYWAPDWVARYKAVDLGCKLKNYYPSKKHQTNDTNIVVRKVDYVDIRTN